MRSALLIVNPTAGARGPLKVADTVREHLLARGWTVHLEPTQYARHAIEIAAELGPGNDMVVAIGGDGTLRETVRGLGDSEIPVGVVPLGNANVVARELGIPQDTAGALEVLTGGRVRHVDVGRVGDDIFLAMVGIGYDAWVAAVVGRVRASNLGGLLYNRGASSLIWGLAGIPGLLRMVPNKVHVCVDGCESQRRYPSVVVSNTEAYALSWAMAPGADVSDGKLDHHLNRRTAPWFVLWTLGAAVMHRRLPPLVAEYGSGRSYTIRSHRPFHWQIDGDPMPPATEVRIEITQAKARIMVPANGAPPRGAR